MSASSLGSGAGTGGHAHDHHHGGSDVSLGPLADASARLAQPSDAAAIGLVQAEVFRDAYADVLPPEVLAQFTPQPFAQAWRAALDAPPSPTHRLLVACAGEQVAGFVALAPDEDPDAADGGFTLLVGGVHPQGRRQGHGSRLLNAAVDTVRPLGASELSCWLLASDTQTRAFLEQAGFHPDGAHRDRVVSTEGDTRTEVRLRVAVGEQ